MVGVLLLQLAIHPPQWAPAMHLGCPILEVSLAGTILLPTPTLMLTQMIPWSVMKAMMVWVHLVEQQLVQQPVLHATAHSTTMVSVVAPPMHHQPTRTKHLRKQAQIHQACPDHTMTKSNTTTTVSMASPDPTATAHMVEDQSLWLGMFQQGGTLASSVHQHTHQVKVVSVRTSKSICHLGAASSRRSRIF